MAARMHQPAVGPLLRRSMSSGLSVLHRLMLLLLLLVALAPDLAHGLVFDIDTSLNTRSHLTALLPIPAFGFLPGGTVSFSLRSSGPFYLLLMSENVWLSLRLHRYIESTTGSSAACVALPSAMRILIPAADPSDPAPMEFSSPPEWMQHMQLSERYVVIAQNCPTANPLRVTGSIVVMNPGNHLSAEDIPYPSVYALLFIYDCGVLLASFGWKMLRFHVFVTRIHHVIAAFLSLRSLQVLLLFRIYSQLSYTGTIDPLLDSFEHYVAAVSDAGFLATLMLISLGWRVTRVGLTGRERRLFILSFAVYLLLRFSYASCLDGTPRMSPHNAATAMTSSDSMTTSSSGHVGSAVCSAFVLGYSVIGFLITFGIIVALNGNIERLRAIYIDSTTWRSVQYLSRRNLHRFWKFRWSLLSYLVLPIIFVLSEITLLSWRQDWLVVFLRDVLAALINGIVTFYFAPSKVSVETDIRVVGHN